MSPSASVTPLQQPLQSQEINNQNNTGLNGNGSNNNVNSGNSHHVNQFNITQVATEEGELDRLLDIYVSRDARHSFCRSPPKCHPGTRKTVLNEIGEWMDDRSLTKSPLLWLNGPSGVGKSVLAKTIAASHWHDEVIATFFFSTSSDRTATTLFPTLARQLAWSIPETTQHIIASLKKNGPLLTSELEEQFDRLIVQPLRKCKLTSKSLPVMVIDGVDECTDEDMLLESLKVLVRAAESGDMPLRFIIWSRPEPRIHAILNRIHDDNQETERQSIPLRSVSRRPQLWIKSFLPDIKTHLFAPMIWGFRNPTLLLQGIRKLYRPVRLGVDKGGQPSKIHGNFTDRLDKITHHRVISVIQIGFSAESREDIAKYLTDTFDEMGRRLREDT